MPDPIDPKPGEPEEDPFQKIARELEAMDLPDAAPQESDLEARMRELVDSHRESLTPDEEVEQRLSQMSGRVGDAAAPPPDPESFDERLRKLEQASRQSRESQAQKQAERDRANRQSGADARGLGFGLTLAYTIIGLPLLGAGVGYLIDRGTDSNVFMGLGTLTGAVIGIAAATFMMNRGQK